MSLAIVGALLQAAIHHQLVRITQMEDHLWTLEVPLAAILTILMCKGSKSLQKVVKKLHKKDPFGMIQRLVLCPWRIPRGR